MLRVLARACLIPWLALLAGCATNPVSGKSEFSLVSSAQEAQMGKEGYPAVVSEYGLYADTTLQAYVDSVGQRVAKFSHLPKGPWKFTLLEDTAVNAFAMPGGYIYITRGILAHLNSEAQLAGVLGHEIGHVTARHSAHQITQQQIAGLGLGLATVFSRDFARYSGVAQQGLQLMFLKYSRDDETQADELGVGYATAAGYDPREIPSTYAMLKRVSDRAGQRLPGYMSTHPDPGQREERTRALANKAAAGKTGLLVGGPAHLHHIDGIVFGRDPRQGYFEGTRYYHPALRFQLVFPDGWKVADSRSALVGASPDEKSQIQATVAAKSDLSPSAFIAALKSKGRIADARGADETIGGYAAWVGDVLVQDESGAQSVLHAALIRKTPELMFQFLGKSPQQGDAGDEGFRSTVRSFRELSDAARINVKPDRVKLVSAKHPTDFMSLIQSQGSQAIGIDETAILNNAQNDQPVNAGELYKIVVAGRAR